MTVAQGLPAQLVHQVDPALGLGVVLVVPGDVDAGPGGPHGAQRGGLRAAAFGRAVRDVTGMADEVGLQGVDLRADPLRPADAVERAVVGVGDESDADAVQSGSQARELHVEPAHAWHPAGLGVSPGEQDGGQAEDGPGDDPGPVLPVAHARHGQGEPQQDTEQDGPGEQHPADSEEGVSDDRRPVLLPSAVAARHRERHGDQTEDEQGGAAQRHGERPVLPGVQKYPAGNGPQQDGCDQRDVAHQAMQSSLLRRVCRLVRGSGFAGVGHAAPPRPAGVPARALYPVVLVTRLGVSEGRRADCTAPRQWSASAWKASFGSQGRPGRTSGEPIRRPGGRAVGTPLLSVRRTGGWAKSPTHCASSRRLPRPPGLC